MKIAVLQKLGTNDYQVWYNEVPGNIFEEYTNEGMSVRGTLDEILTDIKTIEDERPDPLRDYRNKFMEATPSEICLEVSWLRMAFGAAEYADKCAKLEILKEVVRTRGLDK